MSIRKRLFLFAAYDRNGIIDDALIHYLKTLSQYGDIVICFDNDCEKSELEKIAPFVFHAIAKRHGEYDFGSYKRCFQYARDKRILRRYDFIYFVNDSVFGPLKNIDNIIYKMERPKIHAVGMVTSIHKTHEFMESWFICIHKRIFSAKWLNTFMSNIRAESDKASVTIKYEHGFTNLLEEHKCTWTGLFDAHGRYTYNHPCDLFLRGCPFVKKASFLRHNGALGAQIKYILRHSDKSAACAVMNTAKRLYSEKYMNWFLTYNPLKIIVRYIKYIKHKLTSGK